MWEKVKVKNFKWVFVDKEIEPYWKSVSEKFIEQYWDKIMKDTLKSLDKEIQRLKKDKEELRIKDNDNFWEIKKLKEEVKTRKMIADENWEHYDMMKDEYEKLEKENKELKAQIKKYEDKMMRRFAEINMICPQSKQMAVLKEFWYSEWYDRVKAEMRREIIWEKEKKEKKKPKAKNAWLIKKLFRERKKGLDELKKK